MNHLARIQVPGTHLSRGPNKNNIKPKPQSNEKKSSTSSAVNLKKLDFDKKKTIKASDTLEHQPTVWPVPNTCAEPYHPEKYKKYKNMLKNTQKQVLTKLIEKCPKNSI